MVQTATTNRALGAFEQVAKSYEYALVENSEDKFDDSFELELLDLDDLSGDSVSRKKFISRFGAAMEDVGFALLANHGMDNAFLGNVQEKALELFLSTSNEKKKTFMDTHFAFGGTVRHGYFPVLESTETHPNAVEAWEFIRDDFLLPNEESPEALKYWPDERFEKIFRSYWQHSEKLVLPIMRALLEYLDADISLYDNELSPANILLRLNHYPPVPNLDSSLNSVNRFMAHEDYGLLTFLPSNSIEGLQIFHPQREAWVRLNPPEGTLIVNSGDWLKLISNDRFHSCTHRVSMPQSPDMRAKSRISTPFVILPYESSVIEVIPGQIPKYKPTNGLDFMAGLAGKIVKYDSVKLNQI